MRSTRLHVQLYLVMLGTVLLCLLAVGVTFRVTRDRDRDRSGPPAQRLGHAAALLAETRPDLEGDDGRERLAALADSLAIDVLVGDAHGVLLASPSARPFPAPQRLAPGWRRGPGGPLLVVGLEPDRWAALRPRFGRRGMPWSPFFTALGALAVVMAVASYPLARRITRRLELLTAGVRRWGGGELDHRVEVGGSDEVATLASTFNQAAARIDHLIDQQRQLLANTSHELRSPLARVRMAIELVAEEEAPERRLAQVEEIRRDIVELDALIEELLLFARADTRTPRRPFEPVPLRALVESEAARTGATVDGADAVVDGDAVLLRHVARNLLENAARHGGGGHVRAVLEPGPAAAGGGAPTVVLAVEDGGPGIPDEDRERIFAPFYRRPGSTAAPGHGLGLALVRQVARYHGGEARHVPRDGGGSRFEVVLPLAR